MAEFLIGMTERADVTVVTTENVIAERLRRMTGQLGLDDRTTIELLAAA
jgi:hypothetical protein